MAYQDVEVGSVENVGLFDRVNRLILGLSAIMVNVVFTVIPEATIVALVAIGIYAGLTAFIGWDPLYALAGLSRPLSPAPTTPHREAVAAERGMDEQGLNEPYRKAA